MPEPTSAHNSPTTTAASVAPITTSTSSKKTVMEEEQDIDAPKLVQKLAAATISAGSDKVEAANTSAGSNATETHVNEPSKSVESSGHGSVTGVKECSQSGELGEGNSKGVEEAIKGAEPVSGECLNVNQVKKSAELASSGNAMDVDKATKRNEPAKSAQTSDTKPLNVNEPSKNAEPAKPTPTSGQGSTAGTSQSAKSTSSEANADEKVGENGFSNRDSLHTSNLHHAIQVVNNVGPMLQMQAMIPNGGPASFMMEKSVFDRRLVEVNDALNYYKDLRKRASLTQNQQQIVIIAKRARDDLRRLQRLRDGSSNVTVVDL